MQNVRLKVQTVQFRFFGALNDLLPLQKRRIWFAHSLYGQPAIKDTIESLGVPHTEVDCILIHGKSVDLFYHPRYGDRIAVYSEYVSKRKKRIKHLNQCIFKTPRFILDSHLGKLARYLRLLGFDVLYQREYLDQAIAHDAKRLERIVLTRDVGLLKNKIIRHGYWMRKTNPKKQIKEVIKRFHLAKQIRPFRVCLECNGKIKKVAKKKILKRLLPETKKYYRQFFQCNNCQKIYWQGTHFEKLRAFIMSVSKAVRNL